MDEGYIVWNESTTGSEFFGVYRTIEKAEEMMAKVKKSRYGNMTEEEIEDYEVANGDSIQITYFKDTNGKG